MEYLVIKWLHILSSAFLLGTAIGSAFYMFFASLTRDAKVIGAVMKYVVIADLVFTTPTLLFQPASGFYLRHLAGFPNASWLAWSVALYFLAGICWLPVMWMQMKMRDMAQVAAQGRCELPLLYWRYLKIWVALGVIVFLSLVLVFYLMVAKPA